MNVSPLRYERLPFTAVELERIRAARVLLLGAGAIGANLALLLLRSGVASRSPGHFYVVDGDAVSEENLASQPWRPEHVGLEKTKALLDLFEGIAPETNATFWTRALDRSDLAHLVGIARTVDLVVFAIDSFDLVLELSGMIDAPHVAAFLGPQGAEAEIAFSIPGATASLRETISRRGGLLTLAGERVLPARVLSTAAYLCDVALELLLSSLPLVDRGPRPLISLYADCPLHVLGFERTGIFSLRPSHETRSALMVRRKKGSASTSIK